MKMRLIVILVIVTCMVMIVSIAVRAQSSELLTYSLTTSRLHTTYYNITSDTEPGGTAVLIATKYVFLPLTNRSPKPWIDTSDRQTSLDYFNQVYLASEGVDIGWTGDPANCVAGETSPAFREAVRLRINYFRAMAGVPAIVQLSDEYNSKAQQAALMTSVNDIWNHEPPPSYLCYTAEGAEASWASNLSLGRNGPEAVKDYIEDRGPGNFYVVHRRLILYPQTEWMGTGDMPDVDNYKSSNALWVFDENMEGPRPQTREEYVTWPPSGYIPYQVVYSRWSFSYADADFSGANVTMSSGGQNIPLTVQPLYNTGYGFGENTLVWEPDLTFGTPPPSDTVYDVTVSGVMINNMLHDFAYQVIMFDPGP